MCVGAYASIRAFGLFAFVFLAATLRSQPQSATVDPVLAEGLSSFDRGLYRYALPRLLQAANHGNPVAMRRLGILYQNGLLHRADAGWGLQWFQRAVFAGDATAKSYIGDDYAQGKLGSKDPAQALIWYQRAYAAKDARGTLILAELAYRGTDENTNLRHGRHLLDEADSFRKPTDELPLHSRLAADYFELAARYDLGKDAPHNPALAATLYGKSAALGQLSAAVAESALYLGQHGLRQNLTKATAILDDFQKVKPVHYRMAENNDDALALGKAYAAVADAAVKLGSAQRMNAVPNYQKAAQFGVALPMVQFAKRLATGDGIARSVAEAYSVLLALPTTNNASSDGTSALAAKVADLLAAAYANGDGVAIDQDRATSLSRLARQYRSTPLLMATPQPLAAEAMPVPSHPIERYPNMQAPSSVAPSAQFPVSVSLNATKLDQNTGIVSGDNGSGQLTIPFPDGMTSIQIVVTLMPSKMTIVDGVYQRTIELTRTQDTLPAVFLLKANADPGPSTIFATLSYNGAPIGMIRRDVIVGSPLLAPPIGSAVPAAPLAHVDLAPRQQDAPPAPPDSNAVAAPRIAFNSEERAADMIISETVQKDGSLQYFVMTKEQNEFMVSPLPGSSLPSQFNLAKIVDQLYSDIESLQNDPTLTSTQLKTKVDSALATFSDKQAPDAFTKMYEKLIKRGERPQTILVMTDKPVMPWELLRPRIQNGPHEDPLGLTVSIVHTNAFSDPKVPPPLIEDISTVAVVAPVYTSDALDGAQQEVKNMQVVFPDPPQQVAGTHYLQQVEGTLTPVDELAKHPPNGIIHYAGHGIVVKSRSSPDSFALPLADGNTMDPATWKSKVEEGAKGGQMTHPFYFFNACDQGQSEGVRNYVYGWAPALMQSGASGYLGALWKVSDTTAESFSKHFYTELAQKMQSDQPWSVAEVVTHARAATYKEKFDPTALSYILYSHPYLTMNQQ